MSKQVEIKNLIITCNDVFEEPAINKVAQNACRSVNLSVDHVNLVKVDIGNMRTEQADLVLKNICETFKDKGIDNCIFVPICKQGIQDITIERIEVYHEGL